MMHNPCGSAAHEQDGAECEPHLLQTKRGTVLALDPPSRCLWGESMGLSSIKEDLIDAGEPLGEVATSFGLRGQHIPGMTAE